MNRDISKVSAKLNYLRFILLLIISLAITSLPAVCDAKREHFIEGRTMGTTYHITVVTGAFQGVAGLKEKIDFRLKEINHSMSTYQKDSEISRFNRFSEAGQKFSAYGMGVMGYTTPNIDSIGMQGIRFTDHYAQPSCTAGRASFITGQYPIRSGMTTVGQPGDALGLQAASPSLAEVLKEEGYATGQFGKNHLGDRNAHLPTVHGFDEFFGNLYHLNTQEESEQRDYQNFAKAYSGKLEDYEKKFGTRGVLHCVATDTDDPTEDPRFGKVGKQKCEDRKGFGSANVSSPMET